MYRVVCRSNWVPKQNCERHLRVQSTLVIVNFKNSSKIFTIAGDSLYGEMAYISCIQQCRVQLLTIQKYSTIKKVHRHLQAFIRASSNFSHTQLIKSPYKGFHLVKSLDTRNLCFYAVFGDGLGKLAIYVVFGDEQRRL